MLDKLLLLWGFPLYGGWCTFYFLPPNFMRRRNLICMISICWTNIITNVCIGARFLVLSWYDDRYVPPPVFFCNHMFLFFQLRVCTFVSISLVESFSNKFLSSLCSYEYTDYMYLMMKCNIHDQSIPKFCDLLLYTLFCHLESYM